MSKGGRERAGKVWAAAVPAISRPSRIRGTGKRFGKGTLNMLYLISGESEKRLRKRRKLFENEIKEES